MKAPDATMEQKKKREETGAPGPKVGTTFGRVSRRDIRESIRETMVTNRSLFLVAPLALAVVGCGENNQAVDAAKAAADKAAAAAKEAADKAAAAAKDAGNAAMQAGQQATSDAMKATGDAMKSAGESVKAAAPAAPADNMKAAAPADTMKASAPAEAAKK